MNAKLLLCLAALPAAVDALGEFHAEEVKTTCPTLVPLRLNQTNTAGSLMSTGTVAVLDSEYQGSEKPAVIVVQEWWGLNEEHIKKAQKLAESGFRVLVSTRAKSASRRRITSWSDWISRTVTSTCRSTSGQRTPRPRSA